MSVRIIRNEKARNTTIWQFFAVAILPLLLAYFGGFSAGKTLKVDNSANQSMIDSMKLHIKALQDSLRVNEQIASELFAMQTPIQDQVYEYADELRQLFAAATPEDDDPSEDLMGQIKDFFRDKKDSLELKKDRLKDNKLYSAAFEKTFSLAEKILDLQKDRLEDKRDNLDNGVANTAVSDCDKEKDELKEQINGLKLDMKLKDIEIATLNSSKSGASGTTDKTAKIYNQSLVLVKEIDKEAKEIQGVLPTLKSSVLGNNKDKVQTILIKVDNILRTTSAIQNLN